MMDLHPWWPTIHTEEVTSCPLCGKPGKMGFLSVGDGVLYAPMLCLNPDCVQPGPVTVALHPKEAS